METGDGMRPDRDEARRLLDAAEEAEERTRNPPLPRAFFIAQAALLAAICCAQMLPVGPSRVVTIVGLIAVVGLGMRWVFTRPGYGAVWPDGRGAFPYMVAMLVLVGVPAVLAVGLAASWLWLVAGALAAATTLEMGRRYRRALSRA
jgi:hypothetical protein